MTPDLLNFLLLALFGVFCWFIGAAMGAAWTVKAEAKKQQMIAERYATLADEDQLRVDYCDCGHERDLHYTMLTYHILRSDGRCTACVECACPAYVPDGSNA